MTNEPLHPTSVYTVAQVGKKLGISKTHAHKLCNDGTIPSLRLGRRIVIPIRRFNEWLGQGELPI
jgi:excisionase family DNA binding protein